MTETGRPVRADSGLFEQLPENAVEHGGDDVTVTVGDFEGGFYVEDGPGIPVDDRGPVFTPGYNTAATGTGFGLSTVTQVVGAHGWTIDVDQGTSGEAGFDVTGVDSPDA